MSLPVPAERRLRRGRMALATLVLIATAVGGYLAWRAYERPRRLKSVVTNRIIWGPQFPALLTALPAWQALGEDEIIVSHDRVLGSQIATQSDALSRRLAFVTSMPRRLSTLTTIDSLYRSATSQGIDVLRFQGMLGRENVEIVREAGEIRLAYRLPEGAGLASRLTLSVLKAQIGYPDAVTRSVDPSDFEGRSRLVTTYSYTDGAVRFVTSNYAPIVEGAGEPSIERAFLKVGRLAPLLPQ